MNMFAVPFGWRYTSLLPSCPVQVFAPPPFFVVLWLCPQEENLLKRIICAPQGVGGHRSRLGSPTATEHSTHVAFKQWSKFSGHSAEGFQGDGKSVNPSDHMVPAPSRSSTRSMDFDASNVMEHLPEGSLRRPEERVQLFAPCDKAAQSRSPQGAHHSNRCVGGSMFQSSWTPRIIDPLPRIIR